jgi:hypothetical protein
MWSITYNDKNPLISDRVVIEASMGHGRVEETNAGLFFCINLAEAGGNTSADPLKKSSAN